MASRPVAGLITAAASVALALTVAAAAARGEQVTVETLACNGDVGFSSFDDWRLHRILDGGCANPNNQDENLQQILLRPLSGDSVDQVLWVTRDEARSAMDQVRANKAVRQQYLKQRNQLNVTIDPGPSASPAGD